MKVRHTGTVKTICITILVGVAAATEFPTVGVAQLAQISVVQDFIYPTGFSPPQAGNGVVTGSIPQDFQTRQLGVRLTIYECTVSRPDPAAWAQALQQQKATSGNSDLMIAAATGDSATAKKLITAGADVNAGNQYGSTALMGAAAGGHDEIIALLLQHKANVNHRAKNGSTALMFAARNGHLSTVETLLKNGADVGITNQDQQTALTYASQGQHESIVKVLQAPKAK